MLHYHAGTEWVYVRLHMLLQPQAILLLPRCGPVRPRLLSLERLMQITVCNHNSDMVQPLQSEISMRALVM